MRRGSIYVTLLLAGCGMGLALWSTAHGADSASAPMPVEWDRKAAANYLDGREVWWQAWPRAQKDQGTLCISCHTVVPYAMARPALDRQQDETGLNSTEKILFDSVEKRVRLWPEMAPFYSDANNGPGKTAQSHATEAVLNAVVLASYDARQGRLRPVTRQAFDYAWALEQPTGDEAGGWLWQDFHLAPWESTQSGYQGAALLAVAIGNAPGGYAGEAAVQPHLEKLRAYLRAKYIAQPLMNKIYVLWASARLPGLLRVDEQEALIKELQSRQESDGGWRLASLQDWKRLDDSLDPTGSDGLATALAVLGMEEAGAGRAGGSLDRGRAWLTKHQQKDGSWLAWSPNKLRDPASDVGRFMTDAATGYAVLALERTR